jgi:hypothetical protein
MGKFPLGDRPGHSVKEFLRRLDHAALGVPAQVAGLQDTPGVGR